MPDTGCVSCATSSAPTAGTAVSWLPGTLLAGFIPAEVWRNCGQVKLYLGGTVTKVVWRTCSDTRPLAPGRPRAKRLRRRTARVALRLPASHCPSNHDVGPTVLHFAPTNIPYPLIRASKRKSQTAVPTAGGALPELVLTFPQRMRKVRGPLTGLEAGSP